MTNLPLKFNILDHIKLSEVTKKLKFHDNKNKLFKKNKY